MRKYAVFDVRLTVMKLQRNVLLNQQVWAVIQILGGKCTLAASRSCPFSPGSHVEYAPRALLMLDISTGQTDGRTDGRQTVTLCFLLDAASVQRHSVVDDPISSYQQVAVA